MAGTGQESETTKAQKARDFEEIKSWVTYLETHGLGVIHWMDLRAARYALDQTDVGVKK